MSVPNHQPATIADTYGVDLLTAVDAVSLFNRLWQAEVGTRMADAKRFGLPAPYRLSVPTRNTPKHRVLASMVRAHNAATAGA